MSRGTKIVATLGPATGSPEAIRELIAVGADVVRLNLSHGTHEEHAARARFAREAAAGLGRSVAILLDLSGPKIRTGKLKDGRPVLLRAGDAVRIVASDEPGEGGTITTTYAALAKDVHPGAKILLDDGKIALRVEEAGNGEVRARVETGGELGERKGMHLPGVRVSAPSLTKKDLDDLRFGIGIGVDLVALSFVRDRADVEALRQEMSALGASLPIIAKIEKYQAIDHLDAILEAANGVMVARGDLGVELPAEQVPLLQKRIISEANHLGVPVITATEMLESMITNPRPTRAETSDVANAIFDGTDAVMLSAETAMGKFPAEAVRAMSRIAEAAEGSRYAPAALRPEGRAAGEEILVAMAHAAVSAGEALKVRSFVVFTLTGRTARILSKHRPHGRIFALTPRAEALSRMNLYWGVTPVAMPVFETTDQMIREGELCLLRQGLIQPGERFVLITGSTDLSGATNMMKVHRVGAAAEA